LRLLLESNYTEAERAAIYSHQDLDENLAKALADPKIKCIYGHFPLRPVIIDSDATVVTLLREPIARSISHYNHYSKRMNEKHAQLMEGIESPEDFTKLVQSNNRQTAFLSGYLNQKEFLKDPEVLHKALAILTDSTPLASRSITALPLPTLAKCWAGRTRKQNIIIKAAANPLATARFGHR